jgi:hypothetical protein
MQFPALLVILAFSSAHAREGQRVVCNVASNLRVKIIDNSVVLTPLFGIAYEIHPFSFNHYGYSRGCTLIDLRESAAENQTGPADNSVFG